MIHKQDCNSNVGMGTLPCNCLARPSSVDGLLTVHGLAGQFDAEAEIAREKIERSEIRRVLVNSARHIEGGFYFDSPEERAVEMLLRIAQEIPL